MPTLRKITVRAGARHEMAPLTDRKATWQRLLAMLIRPRGGRQSWMCWSKS
jgi:hypothetical protein